MSSRRMHRSGFGDAWFDRWRSGFALSVTLAIGVAALVLASVIGNRVNYALPRGFGLVGMAVTVGLVGVVLVVSGCAREDVATCADRSRAVSSAP
jgi:hypothetical protein